MDAVDALPYIDRAIDEDASVRAKVEGLIRSEMALFNPSEMYMSNLLAQDKDRHFTSSPLVRASLEALERGESPPGFDKKRYALVNLEEDAKDLGGWKSAVDRLKQTIEYQKSWLVNAQLCRKYGPKAWTVNAKVQEGLVKQAEFQLEAQESAENETNKERKAAQMRAKAELDFLAREATDITRKNFMILNQIHGAEPAAKRPGEELNGKDPKRSKTAES